MSAGGAPQDRLRTMRERRHALPRRTGVRLLGLLLLLALTACADGNAPDVARPEQVDVLVVEQDAGDGSPPQRWTLRCSRDGAAGDHPDPDGACAHLSGLDDPFAPLPADRVCTEQYGGPQTARVTGSWRGEQVDLRLSREDGCAISQWDSLGPLLPGTVGVPDAPA